MKKAKKWLLLTATALLLSLISQAEGALPFKKVAIGTTSTTSATPDAAATETEDQPTAEGDESKTDNAALQGKNSKLTGIPQIDYVWDPNLPRELRGYNLSSYPFFSTVPPEDEIHFKCDGLHDGFYASIEHKCQVYHHCVYGIRHDFLCANFTAFDQKTFICHFVSDVDCAGSQRYWNRNDELYMATTTTSTTTTTTEPPPTPRRRPAARPQRPLRRPYNRRPIDDYYYDEQEDYENDYYEERLNRRRKQRPRQRKPMVDYDDDEAYDEKRSFTDDEKPRRNRFRDEDEPESDDYEDRRPNRPKSSARLKPTPSAAADRRKATGRKPDTFGGRNADERRSFSDDRPRKEKVRPSLSDDSAEPAVIETNPRRLAGRRRINERRSSTAAALDDLDDYEKPNAHDQEEAAEEEAPQKVKTTPKPLEEFITPKAASSSVYARPRAPPRIARPVPVNEKKKYQYPVQKLSATTPSPSAVGAGAAEDDDYYQQDIDYDDTRGRSPTRHRVAADEDVEDVPPKPIRRRTHNDAPVARKPTRTTLRKPVTEKKALVEDEEYDSERYDSRGAARKRPIASRTRGSTRADDVDFVDDDYEERPKPSISRQRTKPTARKSVPRSRPTPPISVEETEEEPYEAERPQRNRPNAVSPPVRRNNKPATVNLRARAKPATRAPVVQHVVDEDNDAELESQDADVPKQNENNEEDDDAVVPAAPSNKQTVAGRTASVRVVKRPFLPSRGGSPYLPRGLQPVGVALKPLSFETRTTDSTPLDMGSTISGVHLLEHGAPILRDAGNDEHEHVGVVDIDNDSNGDGEDDVDDNVDVVNIPSNNAASANTRTRTTLPPRSAIPISTHTRPEPQTKINLDELYENDYDVTLNDALDPTLKPLTPQHHSNYNRNYASAYAAPSHQHNNNNNNNVASSAAALLNPLASNNKQHNHHHHSQSQQQQPQQHYHSTSNNQPYQAQAQPQSPQPQQAYHHHNQYQQSPASSTISTASQQQQNYNSDSYFSSTDIRRRAIVPAQAARTSRTEYQRGAGFSGIGARIVQHFYDDFEY